MARKFWFACISLILPRLTEPSYEQTNDLKQFLDFKKSCEDPLTSLKLSSSEICNWGLGTMWWTAVRSPNAQKHITILRQCPARDWELGHGALPIKKQCRKVDALSLAAQASWQGRVTCSGISFCAAGRATKRSFRRRRTSVAVGRMICFVTYGSMTGRPSWDMR